MNFGAALPIDATVSTFADRYRMDVVGSMNQTDVLRNDTNPPSDETIEDDMNPPDGTEHIDNYDPATVAAVIAEEQREEAEERKSGVPGLTQKQTRRQISYLYQRMGCPNQWSRDGTKDLWGGAMGLIRELKDRLLLECVDDRTVRAVLIRTLDAFNEDRLKGYDDGEAIGGRIVT